MVDDCILNVKPMSESSSAGSRRDDRKAEAKAKLATVREARTAKRRHDDDAPTPADLSGRQRLIDAAIRLHGERRSFASLGIREIAREANLNPNTFYRHFESIDDLAVAAVEQIGDRLRPMLHQIHRLASRVDPLALAALEVSAFYAFALGNAEAFVVGVIEYHGGSPRVRESIGKLLSEVARELRDDVVALPIFSTIAPEHLARACEHIVLHLFHLSQDYVERPERRQEIAEASEYVIVWTFLGAAAGSTANAPSLPGA